jgi:hypothetical protein
MRVIVSAFSSNKHIFSLYEQDTIFTLRYLLSKRINIKEERIRLVFNRQELEDHHTLSHYTIKNNSRILLLFLLPGETWTELKFASP